jgi:hypothetical protein
MGGNCPPDALFRMLHIFVDHARQTTRSGDFCATIPPHRLPLRTFSASAAFINGSFHWDAAVLLHVHCWIWTAVMIVKAWPFSVALAAAGHSAGFWILNVFRGESSQKLLGRKSCRPAFPVVCLSGGLDTLALVSLACFRLIGALEHLQALVRKVRAAVVLFRIMNRPRQATTTQEGQLS